MVTPPLGAAGSANSSRPWIDGARKPVATRAYRFTASLASLKPKFYSYGSAVIGTIQQVAGAAGIAVMMAVFTTIVNAGGGTEVPAAVAAGTRTSVTIGAVIATITIIGAFLIRKPEDDGEGPQHGGH